MVYRVIHIMQMLVEALMILKLWRNGKILFVMHETAIFLLEANTELRYSYNLPNYSRINARNVILNNQKLYGWFWYFDILSYNLEIRLLFIFRRYRYMPPIIISYFSTFRRKSVIYQPSITLNLAFAVKNAFLLHCFFWLILSRLH